MRKSVCCTIAITGILLTLCSCNTKTRGKTYNPRVGTEDELIIEEEFTGIAEETEEVTARPYNEYKEDLNVFEEYEADLSEENINIQSEEVQRTEMQVTYEENEYFSITADLLTQTEVIWHITNTNNRYTYEVQAEEGINISQDFSTQEVVITGDNLLNNSYTLDVKLEGSVLKSYEIQIK